MATHSAFGLKWSTPFTISAFSSASSDAEANDADVSVTEGKMITVADVRVINRDSSPQGIRFGMPGAARLWISGGNSIVVERHTPCDESLLQLLLIGAGSALLLHQRGSLPLHASGIATSQGAVLFAGHSGAGKTTLVNAFCQRGYPMLTEDLAAISLDSTGTPWVAPGPCVTKLWADSAEKLGIDTQGLPRIRPEFEKFMVPAIKLATESSPLNTIYALSNESRRDIKIETLNDAAKLNVLLDHTWQKMMVKRMGLNAAHFQRAIAIARTTRIAKVTRPTDGFLLNELVEAIEHDLQQHGQQ